MIKVTVNLAAMAYKVAQFGPIRKARLQKGYEKRGAALVEKIKDATPVLKGRLRRSIRMVPAPDYPGILIIAGGTVETARGPGLDEALLTEYGTRHEAAEPYFYPTIRGEERPLREGLAQDVENGSD